MQASEGRKLQYNELWHSFGGAWGSYDVLSSINVERCLLKGMYESGLYDSAFCSSVLFRKDGSHLIALSELRISYM